MATSLIQSLFDDPLDVVGDVHGEIDALHSLLRHLGYDDEGQHPNGRRLVFVGDLTDRGPDSPAVVELVQSLVNSGRAQCVLGNHDLNLLLDHRKHENRWFYGEEFLDKDGTVVPQVLADESNRRTILRLFSTLPVALERGDLRVVHACWDDDMIDVARESGDVNTLYTHYHELIEGSFPDLDFDDIDKGLEHQNRNPVKQRLPDRKSELMNQSNPGGRLRHERRVQWWNEYRGTYCVFGHYSFPDGQPRGSGSAFCVDYGIGKRWTERRAGKSSGFSWKLAALRFPERVVVFDEGGEHIRPMEKPRDSP